MVVFSCNDPSFYVTALTVQNLSSTVQSAHIHFGAAGTSGPIVVELNPGSAATINDSGSAATYQAKAGAPPTFDAFLNELRAGKAYINVHTVDCPGGEIRGQIPPHRARAARLLAGVRATRAARRSFVPCARR